MTIKFWLWIRRMVLTNGNRIARLPSVMKITGKTSTSQLLSVLPPPQSPPPLTPIQTSTLWPKLNIFILPNVSQRAHKVDLTSYWRRCDVMTSHRRQYDIVSTSCACTDVSRVRLRFSLLYYTFRTVHVVLLFYVHGKHLRSCRDGQLT